MVTRLQQQRRACSTTTCVFPDLLAEARHVDHLTAHRSLWGAVDGSCGWSMCRGFHLSVYRCMSGDLHRLWGHTWGEQLLTNSSKKAGMYRELLNVTVAIMKSKLLQGMHQLWPHANIVKGCVFISSWGGFVKGERKKKPVHRLLIFSTALVRICACVCVFTGHWPSWTHSLPVTSKSSLPFNCFLSQKEPCARPKGNGPFEQMFGSRGSCLATALASSSLHPPGVHFLKPTGQETGLGVKSNIPTDMSTWSYILPHFHYFRPLYYRAFICNKSD